MSASNSIEVKLLDHVLRYGTSPYVAPTDLYLALFTSDDSTGGTLENLEQGIITNEVSGNGYARQAITFGAASGGSSQGPAAGAITFTASGGSFGTVSHIAICGNANGAEDSAGIDQILFAGQLAVAKEVQDGDSLQFATNSITITMS